MEAIWDTRIVPKRILDPSAGTGVFVSAVDFHAPYAEITCFEKDPATGLILKHLHPEKRVRVQGFERIEPKYAGYYDVAVSNIPFGDVALFDPFFSTHTDPVRRQGTRALHNYFFMKSVDMVREGGLVAFITSQGVLNAEQGRPVREWLMNRCEPVSAIRLPNNLFTEHAGTEVGSDLVILQKKAATGGLSERQRDFIESRKLSNGIRINNLFQSFDRVIHTEAKVGKDPYGKPAMEFTHAEGVDGIDREMRRMLSEDFNRHFNESYCLEHAPEQTPGTPERELSRPRQAERQRAERHEPRLAGEIVKEIIADAVTFSSSGKRRKNAASSQNGGAGLPCRYRNRGDYPNRKQTRTSVTGFCRHIRRRTDRGGSGRLRGLVEGAGGIACGSSTRRNPKISAWRILPCSTWRNNGTETAGGLRRVAFRHGGNGGSRTCHPSCRLVNVQQEPLLTLYDLFGFSAEERRQAELGISKKRNSRRGAKRKTPRQPSLFAPASSPEEQKSEMPKTTPPERDPEDLYASLNWEDNPPINGFYEMMMSLTPERRAELRRQSARQQETSEQRERQAVRPPTEAPKDKRKQAAGTPRTGSLFDTPENPEEEEPGKETPQIREADMKPRPFEGEVAPYFREGTLVTDGQNRVATCGGLNPCNPCSTRWNSRLHNGRKPPCISRFAMPITTFITTRRKR